MTKIFKLNLVAAILFGAANTLHAAPILTDWTSATSTSSEGVIGGISVTFSSPSAAIVPGIVNAFSGFSNPAIYNPAIASTEAINLQGDRGVTGFTYSVSFDTPVENPIIYITSLASILTFDPGISLTKISGEDVFAVSGNTVFGVTDDTKTQPNNDANGIFQLNGIFTNFGFNAVWDYPTSSKNDGIMLQIGRDIVPTGVPEPSILLLFGSGIAGLFLFRKKG